MTPTLEDPRMKKIWACFFGDWQSGEDRRAVSVTRDYKAGEGAGKGH